MLEKMRQQNAKLKKEFGELKAKLLDCLAKVKAKKRQPRQDRVEKTQEELGTKQTDIQRESKRSRKPSKRSSTTRSKFK
jgi:hypothetical protein